MIKLVAALVILVGLAAAAVIVAGGRASPPESAAPVPLKVASPADTFVVHDAPPPAAAPAAPPPAAPAPAVPDAPTPGALDAAIERLRAAAAKPDMPPAAAPMAPVLVTPTPAIPATVTPAPDLLQGPSTTPVLAGPPPPLRHNWTAVTSQGARWHGGADQADPALVIDMGGGRTATVHVDPAFQALPPDAANARVDFLKETILENFPPGSTQFRYLRDGSVMLQR